MMSPMPLGPETAAPILPGGDQLAPSPLEFSFPSPGLGRTPGAHVVQEGRLSLEMFGLVAEGLQAEKGEAGPPPNLASLNSDASARIPAAGAPKGVAHGQPNPLAPNQQPKLTPPALAVATAQQLNAREGYAAKLKQALPDKLAAQAAQIIENAKTSLGLPAGMDSTKAQEAVLAALANGASAGALPRLPTLEPEQLEQRTADGNPASLQPQRTSRRVAAKRARDLDSDVDLAVLPPPKRVARMEALYAQLRSLHEYNGSLANAIGQAKAEFAKLTEENDNLWAATAHIGAAMHAAIEERDAQAGAIASVPSLGEEEPSPQHQSQHQMQSQQPDMPLPPNTVPNGAMVPVGPSGNAGLPLLTPGTIGLASLFSPNGDELFAACNMFVSPADRVIGLVDASAEKQLKGTLFPDNLPTSLMRPRRGAHASNEAAHQQQQQQAPQPALSEERSFSFHL